MAQAKIRAEGLILSPINPANALPGEIYRDVNNADTLTDQSTGGSDVPIGAASSDSLMNKLKQNTSGVTIPANTLVALKTDGGIRASDSDSADGQIIIGVTKEEILNNATGLILLFAPNAKDVLTGLGFAPGDTIYMNENGATRGFTNNFADLTGDNDSIISVGFADCSSGNASLTVNDLIMFASIEARP